jgi:hypothetical protein
MATASTPAPTTTTTSAPAPAPTTINHSVRKSVAEKEPRSWTCTAETLDITQPGTSVAIPYGKIATLRLSFEPGRFATNRCTAEVVTNTGWTAQIDNQHWAGVGNFEDRSLTYRLAIEALLARLRVANPQAVLETGKGAGLWLSMGFLIIMLVVLFFVVLTIGGPLIALIKLGIVACYTPTMLRYVRANRRRVQPISADPPAGVLPWLG